MNAPSAASLNDLQAFTAVARTRNFRRAASELGVSPSALSHTLRGLEARLGVRLLNRTTRSVAPTEAGQRLLGRLSPALLDIQGALDEVNAFLRKEHGLLVDGASVAAAAGGRIEVRNPATGQVIASVADADAATVQRIRRNDFILLGGSVAVVGASPDAA